MLLQGSTCKEIWSTGLLDLAPGLSQGRDRSLTSAHVGVVLLQEDAIERLSHKEADGAAKVAFWLSGLESVIIACTLAMTCM